MPLNGLAILHGRLITPHFARGTLDNFTNVLARALANAQGYLADGSLRAPTWW